MPRCTSFVDVERTTERIIQVRCQGKARHTPHHPKELDHAEATFCCDHWPRMTLSGALCEHAPADDPGASPGSPETAAPRPRE